MGGDGAIDHAKGSPVPADARQRLRLDGRPEAVRSVRRVVRDTVAGSDFDAVRLDAELVASELATNAMLHGAPPVEFNCLFLGQVVRLELSDASHLAPMPSQPNAQGMTGRGIALVSRLAERWGVDFEDGRKVVWAELDARSPTYEEPVGDVDIDELIECWPDLEAEPTPDRYAVTLGDVPTTLLLEAKTHVDNLIREFVLASGGAASGTTAEVPLRLSELIETVTTRFAEARYAIKRQALAAAAAGEPRTHLTLTLPLSAADAAAEYLAALDEADAYARAARLLTLETPPEHRAFRRWYVTALVNQLRIAAAGESSPAPTFEEFLLGELSVLTKAQRSTDRSARLQAVTAALARAATTEDVAAIVVSEGMSALGATAGGLLMPGEDERITLPGALGYPAEVVEQLRAERRNSDLPAAQALRTGQAVWLESRQERDSRFPALSGLEPATMSMCAVPLAVGDDVVGALRFSFELPRLFDRDERAFVYALAAQTAQALQRALLFAAERAASERTSFLAAAIELLTSSLEPQETMEHLMTLLVPAIADWAVVYLLDEFGEPRAQSIAHREPAMNARIRDVMHQRPLDTSTSGGLGEVLRSGVTIRYGSVPDEVRERAVSFADDPEVAAAIAPYTGIGVPLIARGKVIGALALARTTENPYTVEDERLAEDVAARAAVAVVNAQAFQRERETAITLQHGLLPQRPPHVAGAQFAWRYLPAGVGTPVGGDWYDVIALEEGRVALVIGDVMGRGVEAAAVMGQLRATVRAYASADLAPSEILVRLDAAVGRLEQSQITTAAFAILDPTRRTLTIASAGHLPPLLVAPHGATRYLDVVPGPPLGAGLPDYPETTVTLEPGSMLLLYTDGLVEDRNKPVDEGMRAVLEAVRGADSAEAVCERALSVQDRDASHDDDTALLAVALTPH